MVVAFSAFLVCDIGTPVHNCAPARDNLTLPTHRFRSLETLLRLDRTPKAQHVSVVVRNLEGSQSVVCVCQWAMHRSVLGQKLGVEGVWIAGEDISVPGSPRMPRRIRLRMDVRCDGLQEEHHLVAPNHRPEVLALPIAAALMEYLEAQVGLVEPQGLVQIADDEERCNAVQH